MPGRTGIVNDSVELVLTDELVRHGLADLRGHLRDVVFSGARVVIVDLAEMTELSSEVVAVLLTAHRICRARGGGLLLRNPGRRTQDLLLRTGLSRVLRCEGT
jgi:anti-sigma B factor antagonist